jgi:hypothetical protein
LRKWKDGPAATRRQDAGWRPEAASREKNTHPSSFAEPADVTSRAEDSERLGRWDIIAEWEVERGSFSFHAEALVNKDQALQLHSDSVHEGQQLAAGSAVDALMAWGQIKTSVAGQVMRPHVIAGTIIVRHNGSRAPHDIRDAGDPRGITTTEAPAGAEASCFVPST